MPLCRSAVVLRTLSVVLRTLPVVLRTFSVPLSALLALSLSPVGLRAQSAVPAYPQDAFAYPLPLDRGAVGLAQSLRRLGTRASLIQINAHPDDEDGGMLTYASRAQGADVSLLSLNRGEGGQNVMTGDYWDALGVLRTQEHLAANRYYGDHLYYTRVADFGFSKTMEEALGQWGHERVLADAVRAVRLTRPMVVTSVFAGYVSDGHGHHQVAGLIAQEVYTAAADPLRFPEQIREGLRPWAPLKIYARVPFARVGERGVFDYATGKWAPVAFRNYITGQPIAGVPTATVLVPEGTYNPLFGESYLQVAREGLNQQKSQNGGTGVPPAGRFDSPYHLYASRVAKGPLPLHEESMFDGIDTSLAGIAGYLPVAEQGVVRSRLLAITALIEQAARAYDAHDPSVCAGPLAQALQMTRALVAGFGSPVDDAHYNALHELQVKQAQLETALNQSLGLTLLAVVQPDAGARGGSGILGPVDAASAAAGSANASTTVIAGQHFAVDVHVADQGKQAVAVEGMRLVASGPQDWAAAADAEIPQSLAAGEGRDVLFHATVPEDAPLTGPYFSRPDLEQSTYDLQKPEYLNLPTVPYPLSATMTYSYAGVRNTLTGVVQTARRENGHGVAVNPLLVAPAISVRLSPRAGVIPLGAKTLPLDVAVRSSVKGPAAGSVRLKLPEGWTALPAVAAFATTHDNEEVSLHFEVTPAALQATTYSLAATATYDGKEYAQGFTTVGYPGIRPYPLYAPATYRATGVDVRVAPGLRVGYVMGTGEELPQSLENLEIHVTELSGAALASADLGKFDAIVLGIRTYAARPELRALNQRLLDYVHGGGVLISEYQTGEFDGKYGPYPMSVPGDAEKVVEETAPVRILKPEDALLNYPNRIGLRDFDGWVEERGHGFARSFDPHYTALTETHDAGQDPQTGGLIYARYGKGYYVYLAYAFFREMPEGVPGSYRVMANLLSLGKNPQVAH